MSDWKLILTILVVVAAPVAGALLWWYVASGERGEEFLKQRMQGPYVPVDEEEK